MIDLIFAKCTSHNTYLNLPIRKTLAKSSSTFCTTYSYVHTLLTPAIQRQFNMQIWPHRRNPLYSYYYASPVKSHPPSSQVPLTRAAKSPLLSETTTPKTQDRGGGKEGRKETKDGKDFSLLLALFAERIEGKKRGGEEILKEPARNC